MKNHNRNRIEKQAEFQGEHLRGEVIDTSGENPVIKPIQQPAPNVIVSGEDASDYSRGDVFQVEVTDVKDSYMFGVKVQETSEQEKSGDYQVKFYVVGHEFSSDTFDSEKQARSVQEALQELHGIEGEVERTR